MDSNKLKHKVDIQQEPTSNPFSAPVNWTNVYSGLYAAINPIQGREYFGSNQVNSDVTHRIIIRYKPGILPKMKIKYGTRYFDIKDVIDTQERHRELQIMAVEVLS